MDRSTSPATVRRAAREGKHQSHTSGLCAGFQQANVVMMPATYAAAFLAFCRANSQPCPILTVFPPGRWNVDELDEAANTAEGGGLYFARGCNVRSDIPMYRVYRHGAFVEERTDVTELFRDDMVTFFLGCSFGFERALQDHGIPVRNIEQHRNVSMYRTTRQCVPVPPFHSPLVVSMRPIPAAVVEQARMLTAEQPNAHGAPVHDGDPLVALGIDQHTLWHAPHFGDAVVPAPDDVPVFWACGVTAILAATSAPEIELVITHAPGAMFVTDVPEQVSYGRVHFSERDRVLSVLRHWQEQQCCKAGWAPVLDVRDSHAFHAAHISNSSSIPLEQLGPRAHDLPPKGETLHLLADTAEHLEAAAATLEERGYVIGERLTLNLGDAATVAAANAAGVRLDIDQSNSRPLWLPSPALLRAIDEIESGLRELHGSTADERAFRAVDLACGCGRDVVFLARRPNWATVVGVDYLPKQIEALCELASRENVRHLVQPLEHDLEAGGGLPSADLLAPGSFDLVTVARYLHRPLLPQLATLLRPGGYLVYHTFMKGCELTPVGRPKRDQFLLQAGELRRVYADQLGFEVVLDLEEPIHDGRPCSFFVARKRLDAS